MSDTEPTEREDNLANPKKTTDDAFEAAVVSAASIKARFAANRELPNRVDGLQKDLLDLNQQLVALKRASVGGGSEVGVLAKALQKQEKVVEGLSKKCDMLEKLAVAQNDQIKKLCSMISELSE
jgi:chromosome segregation ATPase